MSIIQIGNRSYGSPVRNAAQLDAETRFLQMELTANATLFRRDLMASIVDPKRDIDKECGYPQEIGPELYHHSFEREGISNRLVRLYPEESWKHDPDVYETEEPAVTPFEEGLKTLNERFGLYSMMERIDIISGIGHYGVLLIGVKDGKSLETPAFGIERDGSLSKKRPKDQTELLYLRPFDEVLADIESVEADETNPRFGQPLFYNIKFADTRPRGMYHIPSTSGAAISDLSITKKVHWTRVIHIADNRMTSEIFGTPRLKDVFNYLYDLRKILSGSGEMFWKGGYPGYSFEVAPDNVGQIEIDKDSMRKEMENFSNSLQRYMALVGVSAKSLAPQVADPRGHFDTQLDAICIAKGIPKRILMGSEQAQLASTQDKKTWNERLGHRQIRYLTPFVIRPVIDRLIALNVLPMPKDGKYIVEWPEVYSPSDDDIATTAFKRTQAIAQYLTSGGENLMPPKQFLTMILHFTAEEAEAILQAMDEHEAEFDDLRDNNQPEPAATGGIERGKGKAKPKGTTGT